MLQLKNITKRYRTGDLVQNALDGVDLAFRDNEFVSILGPSGSGKTTLLNVVGGLDRCDDGDLLINFKSTKKYTDADWDAYRNHSVGFVFQSYNLIPHQTVLSNVELALTIGGVSRAERRRRAKEALKEVGLEGQEHKRPNQMSGGQMQRVAIARALVNDPEIILADEPTGALDSDTSAQIMDLLSKVAEKRLVVMVTHNPDLAEQYSTRIVRLSDGRVVSDSAPFTPDKKDRKPIEKTKKTDMRFRTSLALSAQNLRTKKGRTLLTAFAGSIGIVGIALILALSYGVNGYISYIQKSTMSSYPLTVTKQTVDVSDMMENGRRNFSDRLSGKKEEAPEPPSVLSADFGAMETRERFSSRMTENDLASFKAYLDDETGEIRSYLGENGVVYTYEVAFSVFTRTPDGKRLNTNAAAEDDLENAGKLDLSGRSASGRGNSFFSMFTGSVDTGADRFGEMLPGKDGALISSVILDTYTLVSGAWPTSETEIVLVVNEQNALSAENLYSLGFLSLEDYAGAKETVAAGGTPSFSLDFDGVIGKTYTLIPAAFNYEDGGDGTFSALGDPAEGDPRFDNGVTLTVSGVVRANADTRSALLRRPIAYPAALTRKIMTLTDESPVVLAQKANPAVNVLTGAKFSAATDEEKLQDLIAYFDNMDPVEKLSVTSLLSVYLPGFSGGQTPGAGPDVDLSAAIGLLAADPEYKDLLLSLYETLVAGASYEDNLSAFGAVDPASPSSVSIYTDSFEDKDRVAACIDRYNAKADEGKKITYTDYVSLITSSVTGIVNVISYVLIAFVSVALLVSAIMIGIITHISVLERTKEIGILRSLGASKRNVSEVFNAETVLIGLFSGLLGVGISWLLTFPINAVLQRLVDVEGLNVYLPVSSALALVVLSVLVTFLGGLIPARSAAKKDPVVALRTE